MIDLNKRVAAALAAKAAAQAARIDTPIEEPVTSEPAPESNDPVCDLKSMIQEEGLVCDLKGMTEEEIRARIETAIDMARPEKVHRYPGEEGRDFHGASYVHRGHRGFGGRRRHKRR
jgi:hypothetical protein